MTRILLGKTEEIPSGRAKTFVQSGKKILVANADGAFVAYENFCPHMGGALRSYGDCRLQCTWHGAVFDAKNGEAISGIAEGSRLKPMPIVVEDGAIYWEKQEEVNPWDDFS